MTAPVPLPDGWGTARLIQPGISTECGPQCARSYDHTGCVLHWLPRRANGVDTRFACDMEHISRIDGVTVGELARGISSEEFARRWVVTEVLAKLADIPILVALRDYGLATASPNGISILDQPFGVDGVSTVLVDDRAVSDRVVAFGMLNAATQNE